LGANIGTCITALLASIGASREAIRAALVHTIFNVAGVLIWIGFVGQLADMARAISPDSSTASGIPRQLANVHTFFNIANALLFIGFTSQLTQLVGWIAPDKVEEVEPKFAAKHLDPKFLDVPAIAIDAVRLEVVHLGTLLRDLLQSAVPAVVTGSPLDVDLLRVMDRPIDLLHREIVGYIRQISLRSLPAGQSSLLLGLTKIANDMEHIGDLVATGLVTSARKRIEEEVVISPATAAVIKGVHEQVVEALDGALLALDSQDVNVAADVRQMKAGFTALVEDVASHQIERLRSDDPKRLQTYTREIELTETLDDVFKIIRRMARTELGLFNNAAPKDV